MCDNSPPPLDPAQSVIYEVRIRGHLGPQWADWFGGLTVTLDDNGDTLLTGPVVDQAALYGLLRQVRDLGVPLLSVNRVEPDKRAAPGARAKTDGADPREGNPAARGAGFGESATSGRQSRTALERAAAIEQALEAGAAITADAPPQPPTRRRRAGRRRA